MKSKPKATFKTASGKTLRLWWPMNIGQLSGSVSNLNISYRVGKPVFVEMGMTPGIERRVSMDAETKTRKPRVAPAPERIEVRRVYVPEGQVRQLYRLLDKKNMRGGYINELNFLNFLDNIGGGKQSPTETFGLVVDDVRYPAVVYKDDAPVPEKPKRARKPKEGETAAPGKVTKEPGEKAGVATRPRRLIRE